VKTGMISSDVLVPHSFYADPDPSISEIADPNWNPDLG